MKKLIYMITVGAMLTLTIPVQATISKAEDNLPKLYAYKQTVTIPITGIRM